MVLCSAAVASLGLFGCSGTGQDRVEIPLLASGADVSSPVMAVGDVPVTIQRADLAFGPFYLCAGNTAGDLCDTARVEWLETAVIDTTSEEPMPLGSLDGVSGAVRSWMFDLGISSQLSRSQPYVLEAAEQLGGASFVLEGLVTLNGLEVPFSASVPIQQTETTELGVPIIRKGSGEEFSHDITGAESGLTLRFDPSAWVSRIDFGGLVEETTCSPEGPPVVCQGQVEQTCDESGALAEERDCDSLGQVCLKGQGCAAELKLDPETTAYRSLSVALTTTGRPAFEWD